MDRKERVQPSKRPARSSYFSTYMNRELKIHTRELKAKIKNRDRKVASLKAQIKKLLKQYSSEAQEETKAIGLFLRQTAKERQIKLYKLAQEIGIPQTVLSLAHTGSGAFGLGMLEKIENWNEKQ